MVPTPVSKHRWEGGPYEASTWLTVIATVAVLALVASACSNDEGGGDTGGGTDTETAATDEFGTIEVAAVSRSTWAFPGDQRADAALGQDQVNGIELAVDYMDGTFDATPGTLLGHDINLSIEDDLCTAEGGQAAATALAADPSIVGVIEPAVPAAPWASPTRS